MKLCNEVLLTMKLTAILLLTACLQVSAEAYSQKITLRRHHVPLVKIFDDVYKQSGYLFLYTGQLIKQGRPVSVQLKNATVKEVLDHCFANQPFTYSIVDKTVIVEPLPAARSQQPGPPPLLVQQVLTINGQVTDAATGEALPGVSVALQNTVSGASTDESGKYTLRVPSSRSNGVLTFSYMGYQTQSAPIDNRATINIQLQRDVAGLEEVVVVGYGSQRKENVTGSVATVRSAELTTAPVANVTNALAGRLPGLISLQTSGQPGADASNLSIRGFGSALVIVDGVQTDFRFIDPNQIESVTILKDASASIYGSRAGNGVILVTTKRGSDGKPKFTFTTSQTLQSITIMPKPVNAGQYAELAREYHLNSGQPEATAPFTTEEIEKYKKGNDPLYPNTNWYDELIRSWAPQQQHNISVRGGNGAINYYGFLGYLDQKTAFRSNGGDYKRYNFQSNIDAKILDNLNLQLTIASIIEDRNFPHTSLSSGEASVWGYFWNTLPIYPAHFSDASKVPFADGNGTGGAHVVSNRAISGYNDRDDQNLRGSLALNYDFKFIKGLSARVFTNYESWNVRSKTFVKPVALYTYEPTSGTYTVAGNFGSNATLNMRDDRGRTLTGQFSLSYDRTFAADHHINALALYEVIDYKSDYIAAGREQFLTTALDQLYAGNSSTQSNDGRASENSRVSYVGRLNYDYKNKYLLEAIIRADATPVFPVETRWGYFPGVSLGWRLSEEPFMKGLSKVDNLKIRASYGQSGNDYSSNNIYRYLSGYALSNTTYLLGDVNGKGLSSIGLANPGITWESVTTYNAGVDFAFFNQKLYGEVDVFYRKVADILGSRGRSLPSTFGATLPLENINSSNDRGFELKLGTAGKVNDLYWDVSGNISWSRARWDHYDEPAYTNADQERLYKNSGRWKDRQTGYVSDGLFTSMDEIKAWGTIQDNNGNTTLRPGDIRIVDMNKDGEIDWRDQVEIGEGTTPHWMFGLNTQLKYRDFDLSALIQGAFGYNTYIAFSQGKVYPTFVYEERWTETNNRSDALVPRIGGSGGGYNLATTSMRFKDAGYVRLKTLSLGYNVPKRWLDQIRVSQVRIYAAATNLFTLDKLKKYNIDPETPSFNASGSLAAHTGRYYPQQKTISFGAIVSF